MFWELFCAIFGQILAIFGQNKAFFLGKVLKKEYKTVDRRFTLLTTPPPAKSGPRVLFFTMKKTYVGEKCLQRAKIIFSKAGKDPNSH